MFLNKMEMNKNSTKTEYSWQEIIKWPQIQINLGLLTTSIYLTNLQIIGLKTVNTLL